MNLLNLFAGPDINRGVEKFRTSASGHLLDVRTTGEYCDGHIPGSKNIPLDMIHKAAKLTKNPAAPIYIYCQSGARSRQAAAALRQMGFQNVSSIGGIRSWKGALE